MHRPLTDQVSLRFAVLARLMLECVLVVAEGKTDTLDTDHRGQSASWSGNFCRSRVGSDVVSGRPCRASRLRARAAERKAEGF